MVEVWYIHHLQTFVVTVSYQKIYKAFFPSSREGKKCIKIYIVCHGQVAPKPCGIEASLEICIKMLINENGIETLAASCPAMYCSDLCKSC